MTAHCRILDESEVAYTERRRGDTARHHDKVRRQYAGLPDAPGRQFLTVEDGIVLVGGDAHYWPGAPSTAHRAFVEFIYAEAPRAIILNGDMYDGARISRWSSGSWVEYIERPTVRDELCIVLARVNEIAGAAGSAFDAGDLFWTLGNHDARFERYLIEAAPEAAGVQGTRLRDHFPGWKPAWSVWINPDSENPVVVKHRFRSGTHAARNNVLNAGMSMVTGHLHSLKVEPVTDYRGTRFGVDGGTMAVPYGKQFNHYAEDNPVDWRSGFVVLTFWRGQLLWPEVVHVVDEAEGLVEFRGTVMKV